MLYFDTTNDKYFCLMDYFSNVQYFVQSGNMTVAFTHDFFNYYIFLLFFII